MRLRPATSAARPDSARRQLAVSRYAVSTQLASPVETSRSCAMTGTEIATTLVLSAATKAPADATPRARQSVDVIVLGGDSAVRTIAFRVPRRSSIDAGRTCTPDRSP